MNLRKTYSHAFIAFAISILCATPSAQAQVEFVDSPSVQESIEQIENDASLGRSLDAPTVAESWNPTDNVVEKTHAGVMRSDSEPIPGGFTKEDADKAQELEAELAAQEATPNTRKRRSTNSAPQNCQVYWPSPFVVCGAIRDHYNRLGGPASFLGWPRSNELGTPDGVGRRSEFLNGHIYWHPKHGAHSISTHLFIAWAANGWEAGPLGYPVNEERATNTGLGRIQDYSNGSIVLGQHGFGAPQGLIRQKWLEVGAEAGMAGYPIGYERDGAKAGSKCSSFEKAEICWSAYTGAHPISGAIYEQWLNQGREGGRLGMPISDATLVANKWKQDFEGGTLESEAATAQSSLVYIPLIRFESDESADDFFDTVDMLLRSFEAFNSLDSSSPRHTRAANAANTYALAKGENMTVADCTIRIDNPHVKKSVDRPFLNFKASTFCSSEKRSVGYEKARIKQNVSHWFDNEHSVYTLNAKNEAEEFSDGSRIDVRPERRSSVKGTTEYTIKNVGGFCQSNSNRENSFQGKITVRVDETFLWGGVSKVRASSPWSKVNCEYSGKTP